MFSTTRNLHSHCFKSLSSLLHFSPPKSVLIWRDFALKALSSNVVGLGPNNPRQNEGLLFSLLSSPAKMMLGPSGTWAGRWMSTSSSSSPPPRGRSMRSKVERRMQKESGKTMREVRRAKKIQKKLMTDNERLVYNLKRAKKKVAVLLQKLKKYELPDLPPPRHDPEILTPEQLQAYKRIGYRNKNYVPVGIRGVFGGVVQNMHMHWKFHETVQVCCDNFPKEKIKEMATMIARLSGGIVINIHNVKTIIMFRGRNYRQPKNLIPVNTLTKRKALFKARFEQALESQKLNIKKIEQQLRRSGINPEDPAASASIQRVAASFFNAIDKQEGTPYVFNQEKLSLPELSNDLEPLEPSDEREQAELDRFIADIEDAAEREWAAEEAAEKEDLGRIRYWNKEEYNGRFRRSETPRDERYGDEDRGSRSWKETWNKPKPYGSHDEDEYSGADSDSDGSSETEKFEASRRDRGNRERFGGARNNNEAYNKRNAPSKYRKSVVDEEPEALSDLESAMWESDDDDDDDDRRYDSTKRDYKSDLNGQNSGVVPRESRGGDVPDITNWSSRSSGANSERAWREPDAENGSRATRVESYVSSNSDDDEDEERYEVKRDSKNWTYSRPRRDRDSDESLDSD